MQLLSVLLREIRYIFFLHFISCCCEAIHSAKEVPVYHEQGILGDSVSLPCEISIADGPHEIEDSVVLVLWYREDLGTPIYSMDIRERGYKNAERWSDDRVFGPRAYFMPEKQPAHLLVDNIKSADEGVYRCRVDFKFAQTRNSKVILSVIIPPQKIVITDELKKVRTSVVGPYAEGASLALTCSVYGAKPAPEVTWFKGDHIVTKKTFTSNLEVVNLPISIEKLGRSDLHAELTCKASNNNRTNLSAVVQVDMNFRPLNVEILEPNQPFVAGRKYELICQSWGSRPPARVTWWNEGRRLDKTKDTTSSDGNTTTSILQFIPNKDDAGKYLCCKAENTQVSKDVLETGWKLQINYLPETRINLGASLRADTIKEGADVYFDCTVNALPASFRVEWKLNGRLLHHNIGHGIIISNHSLVLQKVNRNSAGNYTCIAYNAEGMGESNAFGLNVLYTPTCKSNQTRVYGVAKLEKVNVSCEVEANPSDVVFKWSFNNSQESFDIGSNYIVKLGTTSIVSHTPHTEMDYGTLMCTASNRVGHQRLPCIFHIIAAGKPDRVSNCTAENITATSFYIKCLEGYNGGMPQTFYSEIDLESITAANISSAVSRFYVGGLRSDTRYLVSIYAANVKGHSEPFVIEISTLKSFEQISNLKEVEQPREKFHLNTTMTIIAGVVFFLILLACIVATAIQLYCSRIENQHRKNSHHSNESVDSDEKMSDDLVNKVMLNRNITIVDSDEKDPDIIPQSTFDVMEHDNCAHQKLYVSTIEAKVPVARDFYIDNTVANYPSYCTLRNDVGWKSYQISNDTNIIPTKVLKEDQQFIIRTLPRKNSSLACSPSVSWDNYATYSARNARTSSPICSIQEQQPPPSLDPVGTSKHESAV